MSVISPDHFSDSVSEKVSIHIQLIRSGLVAAGLVLLVAAVLGLAGGVDVAANNAFALVPFAAGLSCIISGIAIASRWQKAAFWFSLAMVGQTFSLQLINAGYQLRYQHYKPISEWLSYPNALFAAGLLVQLIVVIAAMRQFIPGLVSWVRTSLRPWQVLILALCFFIPTTTVSPIPSVYLVEFVVAGLLQLLSLASLLLFAKAIPTDSIGTLRGMINRFVGDESVDGRISYGFPLTAAVFVTLLAVILNVYSYERHPHIPDEVAYLMQARVIASGSLTTPAPPVPEAFDVYLMKVDGNVWYPVTPPGWAILLSLGVLMGAPFLINPILAGINIFLCYWLVRRLYSSSVARLTTLLLAVSPWFIFLAMSFMTHMAALTCFLIAAAGALKARETGRWRWGLVSGFAIGFISIIRPLEAVAVAGLIGIWAIGIGGRRLNFKAISGMALGTLLAGSIGLAFNASLTGKPLQFPINIYTDAVFGPNSNAYGFGPDRGMGWQLDPYPGHGPIDALINTNLNVSALNSELLGWTIGSFLMIGAFVCFARFRRSDLLMLGVIAVIYILHFFYYFSGGPDFGARYWFLMIVPLIVLTVRGVESLAEDLREHSPDADIRLYGAVGALVVLTICVFVPWRAIDKYHDFRGMKPDIRELAKKYEFGRSLVLVQGNQHPDYDSAFIYNSLDLSGDAPVFAWDRDEATREKLFEHYGDRPVWIVRSPSLTGRDYEVAAGPISAGTAVAASNE